MADERDGAAREVPLNRLASFEDGDVEPVFSLPPRRSAAVSATVAPAAGTAVAPAPAPVVPTPQPEDAAAEDAAARQPEPETPQASPARQRPASKPRTADRATRRSPAEPPTTPAPLDDDDPDTVGPESRIRPSNVHIPIALLEPIAAKKAAEGLSNGEVIIQAIEANADRLKDLIHPVATSGGRLFASRRARSSRAAEGPLTPLNYRLREADYEVLDQLVEEYNASSRGHLITAALTAFFDSKPSESRRGRS